MCHVGVTHGSTVEFQIIFEGWRINFVTGNSEAVNSGFDISLAFE